MSHAKSCHFLLLDRRTVEANAIIALLSFGNGFNLPKKLQRLEMRQMSTRLEFLTSKTWLFAGRACLSRQKRSCNSMPMRSRHKEKPTRHTLRHTLRQFADFVAFGDRLRKGLYQEFDLVPSTCWLVPDGIHGQNCVPTAMCDV